MSVKCVKYPKNYEYNILKKISRKYAKYKKNGLLNKSKVSAL